MEHTASISAPASMVNSPVSGSFTTEAVKPAAEEALPLVYTARGCNEQTYLRSHVSNQLLYERSWENLLQELTLTGRWITNNTDVDITTKFQALN